MLVLLPLGITPDVAQELSPAPILVKIQEVKPGKAISQQRGHFTMKVNS